MSTRFSQRKPLTRQHLHNYFGGMKTFLVTSFIATTCLCSAADTKDAKTDDTKKKTVTPAITKVDENNYLIGAVRLNRKTSEISFDAKVEAPQDVIEYLLTTQQGKIHETLFASEIRPSNLNIALKLLGYKESKELFRVLDDQHMETKEFHKETDETKAAARFDIFVSWTKDKKKHEVHANELILNTKTKQSAVISPFVYGGSYLLDGRFKPDLSGNMIAIFTDRSAMANFSNLNSHDDTIWYPNAKKLPKSGSMVTLTIRKHVPAKK